MELRFSSHIKQVFSVWKGSKVIENWECEQNYFEPVWDSSSMQCPKTSTHKSSDRNYCANTRQKWLKVEQIFLKFQFPNGFLPESSLIISSGDQLFTTKLHTIDSTIMAKLTNCKLETWRFQRALLYFSTYNDGYQGQRIFALHQIRNAWECLWRSGRWVNIGGFCQNPRNWRIFKAALQRHLNGQKSPTVTRNLDHEWKVD